MRVREKVANYVSIHAPAWGATPVNRFNAVVLLFQSTLPRGERRGLLCFDCLALKFQSTLPRGERQPLHTFK